LFQGDGPAPIWVDCCPRKICCKQHMLCKPSKLPRVISCFKVIVLLHDGQTDVHAQYVTSSTYCRNCSKMHILLMLSMLPRVTSCSKATVLLQYGVHALSRLLHM
jgi:hypothetical protein